MTPSLRCNCDFSPGPAFTILLPLIRMSPAIGGYRPMMTFMRLDFPEPDPPRITMIPPRCTSNDASFDVQRGEIMVILGGSGSGKSSLMKVFIGLYPPMAGDILINGSSMVNAGPGEKSQLQRKLGVMYQSGALFGSLNVLENVRFPLDQFTNLALADKNLTARMLLRQVEMGYAESLMPGELSGGMLKRAGIARAMALGCDILLLDEPSAGLDPITAANLDRTILSLRKNLGFTFVVVTHELQSIFAIADRAIMLDRISRSIIAEGKPSDLREHRTG